MPSTVAKTETLMDEHCKTIDFLAKELARALKTPEYAGKSSWIAELEARIDTHQRHLGQLAMRRFRLRNKK